MNKRVATIEIAELEIDQIKPHPRNPREHPAPGSKEWEIIRRSLQDRYFDPLVWNRRNGCLVSGHLRCKVLKDLGFTHVQVSVVDCDEKVHYALMIHANRHQGEFDELGLVSLLTEIEEAGIDAAIAGFDHKAMMAKLEPPKIDDDTEQTEELVSKAEQLQQKWNIQEGELLTIGNHRLLCGDCSVDANWDRLLPGGQKARMLWCDPPYNVAYDQVQRKRNKIKAEGGENSHVKPVTIKNDDMSTSDYQKMLIAWFAAADKRMEKGSAIYIAHADLFSLETRIAARQAGWKIAQCLIWVKQAFTLGRQDYQWMHEPILYGWKEGAGHYWQGGFSQSTIIDYDVELKKLSKAELVSMVNHLRNSLDGTVIREPRNVISDLHPTIKPTRLVARHLWNSSRRGDTIIELFGGSGTTLVAAEKVGRKAVATELDPKFCAVIAQRMTDLGHQVERNAA